MENNDKRFDAYHLENSDIFDHLNSGKDGLSDKEAAERINNYGLNKVETEKKKSLLSIIIDQINNPIIYLLTAAVIVSFIFGDIPEAIAIIIVILLNTIIGFWMEYQAMNSVNALKKLDKLQAHVRRNKAEKEIDSEKLVPGDIIVLEAGDVVPADARVIFAKEFSVDEAALTGESLSVEKTSNKLKKDIELAERNNMVYKGTAVTGGKGEALVTATGKDTEIGKISEMVSQEEKDEIPLDKKLQKLSHRLIWATVGLAAIFFIVGSIAGKEVYLLLQTSIAWTVAAIPEGLPIVASIALARGMLRLSRKNVLVKKLSAVETLGETTVIFTDKTGTLTENKLKVTSFEYPGNEINFEDFGKKGDNTFQDLKNDENFMHILRISVLSNDAKIMEDDQVEGDELDVSLSRFIYENDPDFFKKHKDIHLVNEDPFDSNSKFIGTVHELNDKLYIATKGAAEPVLSRSSFVLEENRKKKLSKRIRKKWLKRYDELSGKGLKVIATAYQEKNTREKKKISSRDDFIEDMIFTGFICFVDPAKTDVEDALEKCHKSGINVVMVTGDHPGTAENIAEKVNLDPDNDINILKGRDIEKKADEIYKSNLFARVDPRQKNEIVDHYKERGEITAMTGDGVNDAPALKKADIGIAMGKRGTQIAREVADMILKDDSFPSIINAIEEGRVIFGNIRKFIVYQLSYHLAEILIIAGISFSLFQIPLYPLQLLFLNLLSDVFPALALGLGRGDKKIMEKPPKDPDEPIINKKNWISMGVYGLIIAFTVSSAYLLTIFVFESPENIARTIAFFSLAISQLLHVFNMRDAKENVFNNQIVRNKYIWMALGVCAAALIAGYSIPVLQSALSFEVLSLKEWGLVGVTSISSLLIIQIVKNIFKL